MDKKQLILRGIPLVVALAGLFILFDLYFIHRSEYYNTYDSVFLCSVVAPLIQLLVTLKGKKNSKLKQFEEVLIVVSLLVIFLGEYIACYILDIDTVAYVFYPGLQVNTTMAILGSIVVGVVFVLTKEEKNTN